MVTKRNRQLISLGLLTSLLLTQAPESYANESRHHSQKVSHAPVKSKKESKVKSPIVTAKPYASPAPALSANAPEITRFQYLISQKSFDQAKTLLPSLQTGVFAEYAQFLWLNNTPTLAQLPAFVVYVQNYPQTGWTDKLKQTWAEFLAKQGAWQALRQRAGLFDKGDAQCWTWQAYLNTDAPPDEDWYEAVKTHWKGQIKSSSACQISHQHLSASQQLTGEDWEAKVFFALSQEKVNYDLITSWLPNMPSKQAKETQALLNALTQPAQALEKQLSQDMSSSKDIQYSLLLLRKLATTAPQMAYQYWQQLTQRRGLHPLIREPFERHLFWHLAKKDPENQVAWLKRIPATQQDETSLTPILNQAWQQSDWSLLLEALALLPSSQQKNDRWQYWQAKALQNLGRREDAKKIWEDLAQQRSFYGFLAADFLGKTYTLNSKQVEVSTLDTVANSAFAKQLHALYINNMKDIAWREWRYRVAHGAVALNDIPAFAQLALTWGWADFSVLSMGNPQHWDYVHLRFPMPYRDLLSTYSEQHRIPLGWAFAITRRESAYNADVTSHSGAMGLMQLMPKTASMLAKANGIGLKHKSEAYQPELNVQLGTYYLSQLYKEFDQNYLLATASYNAGSARVKQWLKRYPNLPTDQWIELIAFKETRDYVKAVLEYWLVFERLGNLPKTQLAQHLLPLPSSLADQAQLANIEIVQQPLNNTEETVSVSSESVDSSPATTSSPLPFAEFF